MRQDLPHQRSEFRLPRQVRAIGRHVDAGEHDFVMAALDQSSHLRHHVAHRHGPRGAATERNDAERAAVVAAVLDLDIRPRAAHQPVDEVPGGLRHAHDVVDAHPFEFVRAEPLLKRPVRRRVQLFRIADDVVDLRHPGEGLGLDLRRAPRHDDARAGIVAPHPADCLPRLAHGLRRHRAGIDHDRVLETGRVEVLTHDLRFIGVEPAPERDHFPLAAGFGLLLLAHGKETLPSAWKIAFPVRSSSAGPVMRTRLLASSQVMSSGPPGRMIRAVRSSFPRRTPETSVAHAAVPHALVSPAPRSQVRTLALVGLSTWASEMFAPSGNRG